MSLVVGNRGHVCLRLEGLCAIRGRLDILGKRLHNALVFQTSWSGVVWESRFCSSALYEKLDEVESRRSRCSPKSSSVGARYSDVPVLNVFSSSMFGGVCGRTSTLAVPFVSVRGEKVGVEGRADEGLAMRTLEGAPGASRPGGFDRFLSCCRRRELPVEPRYLLLPVTLGEE